MLVDPAARPDDPLRDDLGLPGPWRWVRRGAVAVAVFDLPPPESVEVEGPPELGAGQPSASLIEWAEATAAGAAPRGWTPPERADVESWLDTARLTVRAGALVARAELVHRPDRLALTFPALASIPPDLPDARRAWLEELCNDARARWRLVRVGPSPDAAAVRAEVDLTGVPPALARPLLRVSLEALAWAAEWLLAPLSLVLDTGAPSRTLDRQPPRARPQNSRKLTR